MKKSTKPLSAADAGSAVLGKYTLVRRLALLIRLFPEFDSVAEK